jgi:hypothetical protein
MLEHVGRVPETIPETLEVASPQEMAQITTFTWLNRTLQQR